MCYENRDAAYAAVCKERDELKRELEELKAAEVAPVVHGRWERIGVDEFLCSNCSTIYEYQSSKCGYNYCPNCGARMDGE